MEDQIIIRKATLEDYNGIMEVSLNSGYENDFLYEYVPTIMKDPNAYAVVALVEEKIIGFYFTSLIDGGTTLVDRGGRIRKFYHGRGITTRLAHHTKSFQGRIWRRVGTSSRLDLVNKDKRFKLIGLRKCAFYEGNKTDFSRHILTHKETNVLTLANSDFLSFLKRRSHYSKVFQESHLIVDSVPYRLLETNVQLILTQWTCALVSFLEEPSKTMLTFGTSFRTINGDMYCKIDLYGTVNDHLKSHIIVHIRKFYDRIQERIIMEVRCRETPIDIEKCMVSLGFQKAPSNKFNRTEMISFEYNHNIMDDKPQTSSNL